MASKPKKFKLKPLVPRPVGSTTERLTSPAKLRQYEAVAQTLGFKPVGLVCAQLRDFLAREGIERYKYSEVAAWLTMKKEWEGATHWCWRPLRPKDAVDFCWLFDGYRPPDGFYCAPRFAEHYRDLAHACRPYESIVPRVELEKVRKIESVFGDEVRFFVSDYAVINPDPFIMVRPAKRGDGPFRHETFIFGIWDEPGFGKG